MCSVLRALTPHVTAPQTGPLDGQAAATMLFCLQAMSAEQVEVRAFLAAVAAAMQGELLPPRVGGVGEDEGLLEGE